jgi:hypothetical protein
VIAPHNSNMNRISFIFTAPPRERVSHRPKATRNSGIARNCIAASDKKPLRVPPPSSRQEIIVKHESQKNAPNFSCHANTVNAHSLIRSLPDSNITLCCAIIAQALSGPRKFFFTGQPLLSRQVPLEQTNGCLNKAGGGQFPHNPGQNILAIRFIPCRMARNYALGDLPQQFLEFGECHFDASSRDVSPVTSSINHSHRSIAHGFDVV